MATQLKTALTIIRRKQVEARTGLSRSTIHAKMRRNPKRPADYDPTFPMTRPFLARYLSAQRLLVGLKGKSTPG